MAFSSQRERFNENYCQKAEAKKKKKDYIFKSMVINCQNKLPGELFGSPSPIFQIKNSV